MFFNVKTPIWLISLLETSSIYICLPGVKVGKVTVQPFISSIHKPASKLSGLFTRKQSEDGTNKFVPSERAREGFALISEMKGYSTIKRSCHMARPFFIHKNTGLFAQFTFVKLTFSQ